MDDEVFFGRPKRKSDEDDEYEYYDPTPQYTPMPGMGCSHIFGCLGLLAVAALIGILLMYTRVTIKRESSERQCYAPIICKELRHSGQMEFMDFGSVKIGCDLSAINERYIVEDTASNSITLHLPKCQPIGDNINAPKNNLANEIGTAESIGEDMITKLIRKTGYKGRICVRFDCDITY